jgi:ABC-type xylose transport system substrate-binding protein
MTLKTTLTALALSRLAAGEFAQTVGVSMSNFQEERWKMDESAWCAPTAPPMSPRMKFLA